MSENLKLIDRKLGHLSRLRLDLEYSLGKMAGPLAKIRKKAMASLTPDERETIAAFTARFADYQEHLGKTMRGIAVEEEINVDRFGSVLAFMEKLGILEDIELWKAIRELRNAINHEYDDNPALLFQVMDSMIRHAPILIAIHDHVKTFVQATYGCALDEVQKPAPVRRPKR
jgi:hypothetical protein